MGTLIFGALCAGGGLVVGWMVLPAPKFVQDFWVRMGWAKRT